MRPTIEVSRRELLGLGAAASATVLAAGCAPLAARLRSKAPKEAFMLPDAATGPGVRLFGRAGFGHRPGDLLAYARDGHNATVERLLRADVEEEPTLRAQINRLEVFREGSADLEDFHREELILQLQQGAALRAIYGANPLKERMVDFWSNHFNIYGQKDPDAFRKGADDAEVVRANALGSFPKMLQTSAHSPAMLGYLDNERNRKSAPNENYARELMELHTLGVDGGYTQKDIQEVARCFTGWTVENRFLRRRGDFRFDSDQHDDGEKHVLGHRIPAGGGQRDGDQVLAILLSHPSTGRFLAKKFALYFLGRRSPVIEDQVAAAYTKSGGDIRAMLRPILFSSELREGPPVLKRPLDLVASSIRALDATTDAGPPLIAHLTMMGQAACNWPMPDGYPVKSSAWSGSMLPRWNFAFALAQGSISGTSVDDRGLGAEAQAEALLGRRLGPADVALRDAIRDEGIGVAIAAPEFQWR